MLPPFVYEGPAVAVLFCLNKNFLSFAAVGGLSDRLQELTVSDNNKQRKDQVSVYHSTTYNSMSQQFIGTKIKILTHIGDLQRSSPLLETRLLLTPSIVKLERGFCCFQHFWVEEFKTILISTVTSVRDLVRERHLTSQVTFTIFSCIVARAMFVLLFLPYLGSRSTDRDMKGHAK